MINKYLLHSQLTAKDGRREALIAILISASNLISNIHGCISYVISVEAIDFNSVWITEIWNSKDDHDHSLNLKEVKESISKAMDIIDWKPTKGQELKVIGGKLN